VFALAVVFVVAVAIATTLATSTSPQVVHLKTVVAHTLNDAIKQLQSLVGNNTH
jgi:hypothetical protein